MRKIILNNDILKILNENIVSEELLTEIEPEEIDLKSFKVKDKLHSKIFPNNKLNSKLRIKLLEIAYDFFDTLEIDWVEIKDIIFVGSLANYNWSKYSDIDLHIVISYKDVNDDVNIVEKYLMAKKNEWNAEHTLKMYGFPIEVYVEDIETGSNSGAIYSVLKNCWLKEPSTLPDIDNEKYLIRKYSAKLINVIDDLIKYNTISNNIDKNYLKDIEKLFSRIKGMRKEGLDRDGEMAWENIVFKVLRRTNYLDKLYDLKIKVYDKEKSINKKRGF